MQDLCSTDPTQETCSRSCRFRTAPTRQHELDHTDHTDQGSMCAALKYLDLEVRIDHTDHTDHLSRVWNNT